MITIDKLLPELESFKKELVFKGKNQIIKYSWENTCKKTRELLLNLN